MVSFQKALAGTPRTEVHPEFEASSQKRKREEPFFAEEFFKDQSNLEKRKSLFDIELQPPESPFPSDKWRQYLNLTMQSGKIQSINQTTAEDSKRRLEARASNDHHVTLDLELNLTCESQRKFKGHNYYDINEKKHIINSGSPVKLNEQNDDRKKEPCSPSWLSSSEGDEYKEMVATVCMKCHMLVMLCKSSPACPNCKFMHPPDQNPNSKFLKRRCSLFC